MPVKIFHGDSRELLPTLPAESIDACVTDAPYALVSIAKRFGKPGSAPAQEGTDGRYRRASAGFMGKSWDTGETAFDPAFWAEVLRVLKPGAHLLAFGGTRSYHRLACAIEDAGFEIRDQIGWLYGSGFPKSHNAGNGWGTALKPAWEPIVVARKPLAGTVAANVLQHGTGALNIDGCRVGTNGEQFSTPQSDPSNRRGVVGEAWQASSDAERNQQVQRESIERTATLGRWPANVIHDGSDEVLEAFPDSNGGAWPAQGARFGYSGGERKQTGVSIDMHELGSAARFFYTAKADKGDRLGSKHPTVKPVDLMAYLVRLVTPKGGTVLDPFAGSGTTGMACMREGFDCILIEREAEYVADIFRRLRHVEGADTPLFGGDLDTLAEQTYDAAANSAGCHAAAVSACRSQLLRERGE